VEAANEGTDTVFSSTDYTLAANLENLTLTGTAIKGTGNELNNIITGNDAANILDGGAGVDTLIGGLGNDTYLINDAADMVTEAANGGIDTVITSTSYTLGANVENLVFTGSSKVKAIGNEHNNVLTGNAGVNVFSAGAGKDTLIGGRGADTMKGGKGADRFVFTSVADKSDRIQDFSRKEKDVLVFEVPGFRGLKAGKLQASQFVLGNKALDKGDRFIYDKTRGTLSYDADGLGGAKQTLIATLTTKPSLTAKDFVITANSSF
jgi:Ca2+-binding RTX toxin-like protein